MLDSAARKLIDPPLNAIGASLAARGMTADGVTLVRKNAGSQHRPKGSNRFIIQMGCLKALKRSCFLSFYACFPRPSRRWLGFLGRCALQRRPSVSLPHGTCLLRRKTYEVSCIDGSSRSARGCSGQP